MAFQPALPQQQQQQVHVLPAENDQGSDSQLSSHQPLAPLPEPQTRVIFRPTDSATWTTSTSSSFVAPTQKSASTPGRSRLSDVGSLQSVLVRSVADDELPFSQTFSLVEEDAELDSLDSHLPEFRTGLPQTDFTPTFHSSPVLPTHDGLGSFHLDNHGASANVQEQLYAFEQFNPRRVKRRKESFDLAQRELESEEAKEPDKTSRIKEWQQDQAKYLLQEIKKETLRRGLVEPTTRSRGGACDEQMTDHDIDTSLGPDDHSTDWHEHEHPAGPKKSQIPWTQAIKSIIQELIGVDDNMLSILFGESLPDEQESQSPAPNSSTFDVPEEIATSRTTPNESQSWQDRILARIARELGLLVHRLSDHPGAFSTYVRMQQMSLPYAGLPVIPETAEMAAVDQQNFSEGTAASIQFQPTIKQATQQINVSSAKHASAASDVAHTAPDEGGVVFTQQEWEQDLDVKMVFRYLRSRFTSGSRASSSSSTAPAGVPGHAGLSSMQDTAAKAARVRLHHPLVSRPRPATERRTFKTTTPSNCASQSTRRSVRRGSGSSRNYWDIGGSVGTGSVIASTGPMGSWGDV